VFALARLRRFDFSLQRWLGYMSEQAIYMVNSFQFTRSSQACPGAPTVRERLSHATCSPTTRKIAAILPLPQWMADSPAYGRPGAAAIPDSPRGARPDYLNPFFSHDEYIDFFAADEGNLAELRSALGSGKRDNG
jgi:hypothetical protein